MREGCSGARRGDGTDWTKKTFEASGGSGVVSMIKCLLARRIDDQMSPERFWKDLSFVLTASCLPSRFLLAACVLSSSCLPCVLVLPFCALLLTAGTSKSLRRFRRPFLFALLVHDNSSPARVRELHTRPCIYMCIFS